MGYYEPASSKDHHATQMSISIDALCHNTAQRDIHNARVMVQELLLTFLERINDYGSKGRLIYELASSCSGEHCPEESNSRAVEARNPYGGCWKYLSLVEFPFETKTDGSRQYHFAHFHESTTFGKCKQYDCYINVCPVKYCAPYVLVSGRHWQTVDKVVGLVKNDMKRHMDHCTCSL